MTEIKKYKLNNEEFNYDKKLYIKKTAEKIIGRNISYIELDNIINKKDHRTYTKLIMDYYNISYNKKNKYCITCLIKKAYYGNKQNKINYIVKIVNQKMM